MTENNEIDKNDLLPPKAVKTSVKLILLALDQTNQLVSELKADLYAERNGIPLNVNRIKTEIRNKEQELFRYQKKIENYKKRAKQHKTKIVVLSNEKEVVEKKYIMSEYNRRLAAVKTIEKKVGRKLPKEIMIKLHIDFLKSKLELYQKERSEGPIDQDPRMLQLLDQQKEITNLLNNAKEKLETVKKSRGVTN